MELEDQRDDDVPTPKYQAASPHYETMVYSAPRGALSPSSSVLAKMSPQDRFQERFPSASSSLVEDPCGNGDQSPITNASDQALLLELFRVGGDYDEYLPKKSSSQAKRKGAKSFSDFASHCVAGRFDKVKQILERHSPRQGKPWEALRELLERRETMLRLSPLLLVFCMLYKIGIVMTSANIGHSHKEPDEECNVTLHSYRSRRSFGSRSRSHHSKDGRSERTSYYGLKKEMWLEYIRDLEQNLVQVVVELLYQGANPCAKDVLGRTVCFYGASVYATARSMQATTLCIQAAKSAHCFGKEVILQNMETLAGTTKNSTKYNGMRGLAAGYQVETARRIVYLFGQKTEMAVLNRNIILVDDDTGISGEPPSLCDSLDRLGRVCLTELLTSHPVLRLDVIHFLLQQHNASIDIPDWNGQTIRQRSSVKLQECRRNAITPTNTEVIAAREISSEALKRAQQDQKCLESTCSACNQVKSKYVSLQVCQRCMSVRYCSKDCQALHWKDGGHNKECSTLRKLYNDCVEIEAPILSKGGAMNASHFRKPSNVPISATFTMKVEIVEDAIEDGSLLHFYDKTKECDFCIGPEQPHTKLYEMVKAEPLTAGSHAYVAASFDPTGKCTVYLNRRKIKTW